MKRSIDRILTTHTGSLPRTEALRRLIRSRELGEDIDQQIFRETVKLAVEEAVVQQAQVGIDVVSDGEQAKSSFYSYLLERLSGLAGSTDAPPMKLNWDFPGYQDWWAETHGRGRVAMKRPECVGPLSWRDRTKLETDLENLREVTKGITMEEAFLPSASVGIVAQRIPNRYYQSYEAYVEAIANVMRDEYLAIANAGFILQIDAPEMCIDRNQPPFRDEPIEVFLKRMDLWVEALNHALTGIPEEMVRLHICWGNGERPHTEDVPLEDIIETVLKVNCAGFSVEASNPRHMHEWKLWEDVQLPPGKVLMPGVIDSTTNFVEHPDLVAQRIETFANLVGRENVIASTDCGFGTTAFFDAIYPPLVWAKLRALSEGARIASNRLWQRR